MTKPQFNLGNLLDVPTGDYEPTNLDALNKSLTGGFKRGEMWVIGAMRLGMQSGFSQSMFAQGFIAKQIGELFKQNMVVRMRLYGPDLEIDAPGPDTPEQRDFQRLLVRYARECGETELKDAAQYAIAAAQGMYGWSAESVPIGPPYVMLNDHSGHVLRWVYENWFAIYRQTGKTVGSDPMAMALYEDDLQFVGSIERSKLALRALEQLAPTLGPPASKLTFRDENSPGHFSRLDDTENAKEAVTNGRPVREQNYLKLRKGFKK